MLEELQRLQTHINVLKSRLTHFENQNAELLQTEHAAHTLHDAEIAQKDEKIAAKDEHISQLTQALEQEKQQHNLLNSDATALADRYSRLEKSCTDLKNRFQEILAERNELRVLKEKLLNDQRIAQQEIQAIKQERQRLLEKNEVAKSKVEAIIQRLTILGTAQDQNAQEIQQLEHPTDSHEDVQA
jgi:chromosome segregation ATPase